MLKNDKQQTQHAIDKSIERQKEEQTWKKEISLKGIGDLFGGVGKVIKNTAANFNGQHENVCHKSQNWKEH